MNEDLDSTGKKTTETLVNKRISAVFAIFNFVQK